jgi:hypothetical protein
MGEFEAARKHASRGVQLWLQKNTPPQVQKISAPEVLLNAPAVTCLRQGAASGIFEKLTHAKELWLEPFLWRKKWITHMR